MTISRSQEKQRLKLVKNKKLEDKSKIQYVVWGGECGPVAISVQTLVIPGCIQLNGGQWMAVD